MTQEENLIDEKRKVVALERIADNLEQQNKLIEKSIDTSQRILAAHILNIKIQARVGVALNALDILTHKEFIDLVNQI
jgi:hypothetical protein